MTNSNAVTNLATKRAAQIKQPQKSKDIDLSEIDSVYSTTKTEDKRTTFDETFEVTSLEDSRDGSEFIKGLIDNKDTIMKKLNMSDEKYDSLACIALALASQETGMGKEEGYVEENTGVGGFLRSVAKWFDANVFNNGSASSGLTQMKIYDFLNGDKLTKEQKDLIKELGAESSGVATNNLYSKPDKAAAATIVVLSSLVDNYDKYGEVIKNTHDELAKNFKDNLTPTQRLKRGENIMKSFSEVYNNADDKGKTNIRSGLKNWLLAVNDSKIGDKGDKAYNEEYCLKNLNSLLSDYSKNFSLQQRDLDYIRYYLTSDNQKATPVEYCAYAWNKGTGATGMQPDRLLADKVGIILSDPEDFDYDQFSANVSGLTEKYAGQTIDNDVLAYLNECLLKG